MSSVYPYLRWLGVVLAGRKKRMGTFDESVLRFHVWPGDLDFFFHMNNGRYLTLMDSGRWDIMARLGLIPFMRKNGWISVIGGATIRFLRPLRPFQAFELRSRIVGWDAKWFYIDQRFVSEGKVFAESTVRGLLRAPGRSVGTAEVLRLVGETTPSPPLSREVEAWSRMLAMQGDGTSVSNPREPV